MNIYAIGDLHLSLTSDKPMDLFGARWDNHVSRLKEAWEKKIKEEDCVIICGDISWAMKLQEAKADLEFLDALPGHKICIRGNHDFWWEKITHLNKLYKKITFIQNTAVNLADVSICGTRGWLSPGCENFSEMDEKIYERELIRLELSLKKATHKQKIVAVHYPPTNGIFTSEMTRIFEAYQVETVVYGHLHDEVGWEKCLRGNYSGINYHLVAGDYIDFDPIRIR